MRAAVARSTPVVKPPRLTARKYLSPSPTLERKKSNASTGRSCAVPGSCARWKSVMDSNCVRCPDSHRHVPGSSFRPEASAITSATTAAADDAVVDLALTTHKSAFAVRSVSRLRAIRCGTYNRQPGHEARHKAPRHEHAGAVRGRPVAQAVFSLRRTAEGRRAKGDEHGVAARA